MLSTIILSSWPTRTGCRERDPETGRRRVRRPRHWATAPDWLENLVGYRPWRSGERMSYSEGDNLSVFLKLLSGTHGKGEELTTASPGEPSTDPGSSRSFIISQSSLKTGVTRSVRRSAPRYARSELYMTWSGSAPSRPGEDRSVGKSD
jgi:hypothetical protein